MQLYDIKTEWTMYKDFFIVNVSADFDVVVITFIISEQLPCQT